MRIVRTLIAFTASYAAVIIAAIAYISSQLSNNPSDIGETRDDPPVQESASMRQGRWLADPFVQKTGRGRPVLR